MVRPAREQDWRGSRSELGQTEGNSSRAWPLLLCQWRLLPHTVQSPAHSGSYGFAAAAGGDGTSTLTDILLF